MIVTERRGGQSSGQIREDLPSTPGHKALCPYLPFPQIPTKADLFDMHGIKGKN